MTTNWKALCAELAKTLAEEYGVQREFDGGDPLLGSGAIELLSRVRTHLSQPEPEGSARDLIQRLAHELYKYECLTSRRPPDYIPAPSPLVAEAHAALARWRRPAVEPVLEGPTVMEIIALADEIEAEELGQVDLVRRALARWGRPAIHPEPEESTDSE